MREQIRKKIKNEDLFDGCRAAFGQRLHAREALLPHRPAGRAAGRSRRHRRHGRDDLADRQGSDGPHIPVTASVSNFVPKAHTPYQWNGMQTREYFAWAHSI